MEKILLKNCPSLGKTLEKSGVMGLVVKLKPTWTILENSAANTATASIGSASLAM